jgi:phage recombination protein Bet
MDTGKELQTRPTGELATITVTPEQKALVKSVIFPDSTDDELALFIFQCQRKGVHPLDKFIYPIKRKDKSGESKITFQSSIDYMRSEAEGTGEYAGQDEPEFEWDNPETPEWPSQAKVKIYRKGFDRPFVGIARWKEFYPGDTLGFMYRKMPCNQLAKCAEAQAFRKAFPKLLGELYTPEEMQQADVDPKDHRKDRSASVKPASNQAPIIDGEEAPLSAIDQEITDLLGYLYKGDYQAMNEGLIKASEFTDKNKKKFTFDLERLPTASEAWKNKTVLPRLRKWKGEAEALEMETKGAAEPAAAEEEAKTE